MRGKISKVQARILKEKHIKKLLMKAIFCIHGFITDYTDFDKLHSFFEKSYDCVQYFHVPGHRPPPDFKLFDCDKTFELLLEEYDRLSEKCGEVDVVGFSMGGALASYLACVRKVNRVIFLAPANKYLNTGYSFRWTAFYLRRIFENFSQNGFDLSKSLSASKKELTKYLAENKEAIGMAMTKLLPNYNAHTLITFAKVIKRCNGELRKNHTPCLILYGELDELVPLSSVEYLKEFFTDAKVIVYNDVGHLLPMGSKAEKIIEDISLFIA